MKGREYLIFSFLISLVKLVLFVALSLLFRLLKSLDQVHLQCDINYITI